MHEHIINTPIKDLPPLVEVIFRIHVFPFIVIQKDKQRLAVHWTWKTSLFIVYSKKLKKTENISIQGFGHLSTADSRPWQKSE